LLACPYFRMERWRLHTSATLLPDAGSFVAVFVARGAVTAVWDGGREVWRPGVTALIPAALPRIELAPGPGDATLLLTRLGAGAGDVGSATTAP